jgi:hypothetical protein
MLQLRELGRRIPRECAIVEGWGANRCSVQSERRALSSFWKNRVGAVALALALALATWLVIYGAYVLLHWLF